MSGPSRQRGGRVLFRAGTWEKAALAPSQIQEGHFSFAFLEREVRQRFRLRTGAKLRREHHGGKA